MIQGHPFPDDVNEADVGQASLLEQLQPVDNSPQVKAGRETWTCAWSPDCSYFAWSCGSRKVQLVPWNRYKHTSLSQDDTDHDGKKLSNSVVRIDAGELVWALAFGSSMADMHPHSINLNWWRYKVAKDLVLATGLTSGRIRTWDAKTGSLMLELVDHRDVVRDLKFAPDGSMIMVSASRDGMLKVWDLEDDGNMKKTLKGPSKWLYACAWAPNSKILCSVGDSRSVILWDMVNFKRIRKLEGHYNDVVSCDFSPDGALLVTSSYDTRVILWDAYTGQKLRELRHLFPPPSPIFAGGANDAYVRGVSFSHDGIHVASVSDDTYVRFWNIYDDTAAPEKVACIPNVLCCAFSPDGAVLSAGTRNGSVAFWLAPMQVTSLQHLCRMAIRRLVPCPDTTQLMLPTRLQEFLQYKEYTERALAS